MYRCKDCNNTDKRKFHTESGQGMEGSKSWIVYVVCSICGSKRVTKK